MQNRLFEVLKFFMITSMLTINMDLAAQTSKLDPNDFQGWYGIGVNIDLPQKWEVSLDYQSRFVSNMRTFNGSYFTLAGAKKISRLFTAQADYRLVIAENGFYHRFTIGSEAGRKFGKFDLNFRLLVQNQLQDFEALEKANENSGYWRTRFLAKTALTKSLSLYVATEPIMKFGGNYFIDNIRNTLGLKYKINEHSRFDLFYIYRPDFAKATYNRIFQVVGANIDLFFKVRKR